MSSPISRHIRVFTLNCWGLKYITTQREERINAIASFLSSSPYDIVCLQELFVERDFEVIRQAVSNNLPFYKQFHGGAVGRGMATFSRYPIIASTVQAYSLNGSPLDLKGADWFAGKGAGSVLVKHPLLGELEIFNTHFFSEGGDDGPEHQRSHRIVNAWEFAKFVKQSAEMGRHVIAAGDLNSEPYTLPITVVLEHGGLIDTWGSLHAAGSEKARNSMRPQDALLAYGLTYDSPLNTFSTRGTPSTPSPQGKRLDYIMFRNPWQSPSPSSRPRLALKDARVALTECIPGRTFSYSDHFGVEALFDIEDSALQTPHLPPNHGALIDHMDIPTFPSTTMSSREKPQLSVANTLAALDALKTRLRLSKLRSRWELRIHAGCVAALIGLLVGTGWSPRGYLTPVFVFVGGLITWLGTTMFYVGLMYGGWEVSILQNLIEEMELYRTALQGTSPS
ncbi:inositol phosphophingolipids phospholipase C [Coprinopsis sp. MPI-PUGE-AT-0042]|nr:inositol phosphophingolipids phospholipase C [Coprinopsis sp. MPI-PUGE-AT-0042]